MIAFYDYNVGAVYQYITNLHFDSRPDYETMRELLTRSLVQTLFVSEFVWDWEIKLQSVSKFKTIKMVNRERMLKSKKKEKV